MRLWRNVVAQYRSVLSWRRIEAVRPVRMRMLSRMFLLWAVRWTSPQGRAATRLAAVAETVVAAVLQDACGCSNSVQFRKYCSRGLPGICGRSMDAAGCMSPGAGPRAYANALREGALLVETPHARPHDQAHVQLRRVRGRLPRARRLPATPRLFADHLWSSP